MTGPARPGGFTLVELMVVLSLVALVSGLVALGVRPSAQQQLNREGERLALWLESVRSMSRSQGRWVQVRVDASGAQIVGTPTVALGAERMNWLYAGTTPVTTSTLTLGPEPILPAQQLQLTSTTDGQVWVRVRTQGLGPWTAQ